MDISTGDTITIEQMEGEFVVVALLPDKFLLVRNEADDLGMVHLDYVIRIDKEKVSI